MLESRKDSEVVELEIIVMFLGKRVFLLFVYQLTKTHEE